jgi:hypothetical protein
MESVMTKKLLLALPFVLLPTIGFAEPGSGTDLYRVDREVEAMQRDGRWERLLAEGQANRQAASPQVVQTVRPPAVFTGVAPAARSRKQVR